jgi:hypothetical protein
MGPAPNQLDRYELRFRTRSAVMRAFREVISNEFVEDCLIDVGERVLRFRTNSDSADLLLEHADFGRDLLEMRSSAGARSENDEPGS